MKKAFLAVFLILTIIPLQGQRKLEKKIKAKFWHVDDPYKDAVDIPEKWAKESAVILYQEFNYVYKSSKKNVDYSESTRKRVKLLDKAAVEEYSEFSFSESFRVEKGFSKKGGRIVAGFKVIKSNGKVIEIDTDDAVEVSGDNGNIKKIAIPDLVPGDIIDYYYYIYEPFLSYQEYVFDPIISTLNASYPVMEQKIVFEVGKKFFINFRSLHGAAELVEKESQDKKSRTYSLFDKDREKSEKKRWFYPRRVLPTIKFQVVFARKSKLEKRADAFIGEKRMVKKSVSKKEVLTYIDDRLDLHVKTNISKIRTYLKKNKIAPSDTEKYIREAYNYIRYSDITSKIEPLVFYKENYIEDLSYTYGIFMNDFQFISQMASFLNKEDIPFDILVTIPRHLSDISDILLSEEIVLGIRVNLPQPLFISKHYLHSNYNFIPYTLEGTDCYLLKVSQKGDIESIKTASIPISSHEKNKTKHELSIDFDEADLNLMKANRKVILNGYSKDDYQGDLIEMHDYLAEEYNHFNKEPYLERADLKRKQKQKVKEKLAVKLEKDKTAQKETYQRVLENDLEFEVKSYEAFQILDMGRLDDLPFIYEEQFELDNLVKKAGPNYIIEAGKLIGGQVELKEEEMERTYDIYMPYPRSFENFITINIPEGYTVEGVDKLNITTENETGGFQSTAKMEGNQLKIYSHKYYIHNFETANKWPLMTAFLESAYDFTQQKVLLKKK